MKELRKDYMMDELTEGKANKDPFAQFNAWFKDVDEAGVTEPNAFSLATVSKDGKPSSRMLLLKDMQSDGYIFYSGYLSRKACELISNPNAAMLFYWPDLERQVRIEGAVEKISTEISDKYFSSRPFGAKVSAIISNQSEVIESREALEKKWKTKEEQAKNQPIIRPESWGGYKLLPVQFEFWQGRDNRLHDRLLYVKNGGQWQVKRLAP